MLEEAPQWRSQSQAARQAPWLKSSQVNNIRFSVQKLRSSTRLTRRITKWLIRCTLKLRPTFSIWQWNYHINCPKIYWIADWMRWMTGTSLESSQKWHFRIKIIKFIPSNSQKCLKLLLIKIVLQFLFLQTEVDWNKVCIWAIMEAKCLRYMTQIDRKHRRLN